MKRHNLLLLVYVAFVFICLLAKSFLEYESWNHVVGAVAISSALLAFADFFNIYSKAFMETCDSAERFIKERRNKIEAEKNVLKDMNEKLVLLKNRGIDMTEQVAVNDRIENTICEGIKILDGFGEETRKKRKKQKNYAFYSDILTFLAFLSFLCIIAFSPAFLLMGEAQNIVSVLAFFVILCSQYMNSVYAENHKKELQRHDTAVKTHDEAHTQILVMCENLNSFFEKVMNDAD